jgi:hypothetical protein
MYTWGLGSSDNRDPYPKQERSRGDVRVLVVQETYLLSGGKEVQEGAGGDGTKVRRKK